MNHLLSILSQRRYVITALIALVVYAVLYLVAAQLLVWRNDAEAASVVEVSPAWRELMFRERAPFLYEPIGVVSLGQHLNLYLAVPNLAIAFFLGLLVGLNAAVSYHSFRALAFRGGQGVVSLLGTVPALIGGAACCVPTLILVIGFQMSATLIAVWPLFVPASAVLLVAALWWSLTRDSRQRSCD